MFRASSLCHSRSSSTRLESGSSAAKTESLVSSGGGKVELTRFDGHQIL